ncbi:N-6 DNA methylase [Shewanella youngdeokensis]|uniref:site-specific DNA-methyltransferase (adenine-specific) n=1 Tax=Shewanella youngdeokensis TaxID=2999068 RepID=A0ABZ0JZX3_9GAMM|nr:N-6 DNA methylase [Shewanella sp. DAU334]
MMSNTAATKQLREEYEQFYTSRGLGRLLLSQIPDNAWFNKKLNALDLCMGQGSLLECVAEIASYTSLFGTDIDQFNIDAVNRNPQLNVNTYCIDATTPEVSALYTKEQFDLIVGNPPFKLIRNEDFIKTELENLGYYSCSAYIEAEVYFLLYGLKLLKNNGYLAYILPDGIFTKIALNTLRKFLVDNFTIESIVEIEPKSFQGTEAKTHLIIIKKCESKKSKIPLLKSQLPTREISKIDFINRGDYSYYRKASAFKKETLASLKVNILRGKKTKKNLLQMGVSNYIHTTNITHNGSELNTTLNADDKIVAQKGDIVIARVGTRCLGKFGFIESGEFYISDCVFIVRCNNHENQKSILNTLSSPFGKNWIDSVSKGVGARHITTSDLYKLPIVVGNNEN